MKYYYVTFRSVTPAQRGERLLGRLGIRCTLQRTPRWMEAQGCGYCLRLWTDRMNGILDILRSHEIPLHRVYYQEPGGEIKELAP